MDGSGWKNTYCFQCKPSQRWHLDGGQDTSNLILFICIQFSRHMKSALFWGDGWLSSSVGQHKSSHVNCEVKMQGCMCAQCLTTIFATLTHIDTIATNVKVITIGLHTSTVRNFLCNGHISNLFNQWPCTLQIMWWFDAVLIVAMSLMTIT